MMDFVVAGSAKGHQVLSGMGAAFRNRNLVVYLCHRNQPTFLQAFLTEGMLCRMTIPDSFPCSAVLLVDIS